MFNQEKPDRNDPAQRVQTAQQKRMPLSCPQRSDAAFDCRSCRARSRCQKGSL
jgi:hypothetical protein